MKTERPRRIKNLEVNKIWEPQQKHTEEKKKLRKEQEERQQNSKEQLEEMVKENKK